MRSFLILGFGMILFVFIGFNASPAFGGGVELQPEEGIKGTVKVKDHADKYWTLAKVSMEDAIKTALKEVKGTAISASMLIENGYLVYEICIMDKDSKTWNLIVDAGKKKVLKKECDDEDEEEEDDDEDED